jgi:glycosyltransferase involved in cell wall biosynthesis
VFLAAHGVSPDRLFHAPYSIDNARFGATASAMESTRRTLCESHGLDPSLSTFLFSGKLISKKRPLELFDAFVAAGLPSKAQLVYVGDGPLRGPLLERVRELGLSTVHVLGFLNQSEMPTAYVIGHVLCLLSDADETWGLVVNEAFACARPAIVSEVAGCAADLVFPETGWKVSVDGVLSIAATLERAWRDRDQWPQKGAAARRTVSMHSYLKMADGVIAALTHVSCGGRRQLGVHAKELSP